MNISRKNQDLVRLSAKRNSKGKDIWKRLRRNKLAIVGMIIVTVILLAAIFADYIAPYDYSAQNLTEKFSEISRSHIMGTDNFGRDIFSRIIYGGRTSLLVALTAVAISTVIGGVIGAVSGFFGGVVDTIIMRIMDIIMAIPAILLAVCISAALGTGLMKTALAVAICGIPRTARLMRGSVISIREQEFVEAAKAMNSSVFKIVFSEILPNTLSPIIVDSTLALGGNILQISALSFIGLGVQPPTAEWGSMLNSGRQYIRDYWPIVIFPGLAIMVTLFGFNVLGDGLRDALDPRQKR